MGEWGGRAGQENKAREHCKGLQGITGALQGNWVTGIPHLQGFVMCHFTCNY